MYKNCVCKVCNKDFKSKYRTGFCSNTCRDSYTREQNRKRKNIVVMSKECLHCKKSFTTGYSRKIYCSNECRIASIQSVTKESHSNFWVFNRDNFTCVYCGKSSLDGAILTVDHVYPFTKGGSNEPFNLVTCCKTCNSSKGSKVLSEETILKIWNRNIEKNSISFDELKSKLNPLNHERQRS